jgi:mRNA degradation ribonuclease J1/J2
VFLADATARSILLPPRIESRGFFLPHEIREGHKFLLSESRRSYEETLRDVPDIETKDLEKIVKKDLEKAISLRFDRSPLVIIPIQTI